MAGAFTGHLPGTSLPLNRVPFSLASAGSSIYRRLPLQFLLSPSGLTVTKRSPLRRIFPLATTVCCLQTHQVVHDTIGVGTETAAALKAHTDQMNRIVDELDSIHVSINKASRLVGEIGRQMSVSDRKWTCHFCWCAVFMAFGMGYCLLLVFEWIALIRTKSRRLRHLEKRKIFFEFVATSSGLQTLRVHGSYSAQGYTKVQYFAELESAQSSSSGIHEPSSHDLG